MIPFPRFRPDIPFSRDDTNRFLPWIIGFIVFIAALMITSGMGLYGVVTSNQKARADTVSVHIPSGGTNTDQVAATALATLRATPGVKKAEPVGIAEMQELIRPWVGSDVTSDLMPLPRVITVTLADPRPDMEALRKKILALSPQAEIDDHAQWIAQYTSLMQALQWTLWSAALLFVVTTLAIVVLTTRANIKIHHRVIQILHTVGALDCYIARQFQFNAFLVAGKGALLGSVVALGFYSVLCISTSGLSVPLLPHFRMDIGQALLFVLLPFCVGLGALISSRFTVLAELRRMP